LCVLTGTEGFTVAESYRLTVFTSTEIDFEFNGIIWSLRGLVPWVGASGGAAACGLGRIISDSGALGKCVLAGNEELTHQQ